MKEKIKRIWSEDKFYIISLLIIIITFNYKLPYYVTAPGGTIDISNRIEYDEKYEYDGSLNMLYVTQYEAIIPIYLLSYIIPDWDLESISTNQISNEEHHEIDMRNKIMLNNSINNAIYVAYTKAEKEINIREQKSYIIATLRDTDLKIGDQILEINDQNITNLEDIKNTISKYDIDDTIKVKVLRNNKEKIINTKLSDIDGTKGLGIIVMNNYEYNINPEITLNFKKSESGSSGGLMMALSIYSAISGEDILKGRNIAGTGTIDNFGNVGKIDGIKYKIMGAVNNDMDVILVPRDNFKEAKKIVKEKNYDIELVEINTFDDAIEYLLN